MYNYDVVPLKVDYVSDRRAPPAARDFSDWKRKNAVPPTGKVFSMTGWYPCVKQVGSIINIEIFLYYMTFSTFLSFFLSFF
jgi:hypothetical protein